MNKDFRVSVTLPTHPKALKLMRKLGDRAFYNLIRFWAFVSANKPNGVLTGYDEDDIEIASDWIGEPGQFVKTLLDPKIRFLEKTEDGFLIHDWQEHNGYAFHAQERSEKAKKAARAKWGTSDNETTAESNKKTRAQRLSDARKKGRHSKVEWEEMVSFFNDTCVRCGGDSNLHGAVKDHIIPIYQGGSDGIDNLQPLCARCNSSKGPENKDFRIDWCKKNGLKMPAKWLSNACQTPANACSNACPSPSPTPTPSPDKSSLTNVSGDPLADKKKSNHFREKTGNYFKEIKAVCEKIANLNLDGFNSYKFVQSQVNNRGHPGAILDALNGILKAKFPIEKPWGFVNSIMRRENGNFNEADAIKIHQVMKNLKPNELSNFTHGLFDKL